MIGSGSRLVLSPHGDYRLEVGPLARGGVSITCREPGWEQQPERDAAVVLSRTDAAILGAFLTALAAAPSE